MSFNFRTYPSQMSWNVTWWQALRITVTMEIAWWSRYVGHSEISGWNWDCFVTSSKLLTARFQTNLSGWENPSLLPPLFKLLGYDLSSNIQNAEPPAERRCIRSYSCDCMLWHNHINRTISASSPTSCSYQLDQPCSSWSPLSPAGMAAETERRRGRKS